MSSECNYAENITFKYSKFFFIISKCYQYEQKQMHMSIEWHRGLPLSLQLTFEKEITVFIIINIQTQYIYIKD